MSVYGYARISRPQQSIDRQIRNILDADIMEKERRKYTGRDYQPGSMHMIFGGNPGSAKTTVAKLFAGIAKEKGILRSGAFVECGGMDLDGFCCVSRIRDAFLAASGGVLFIDEAYSLDGAVAVTTLIQEMENHRDEVIVILAGYNDRMKTFLTLNEGLKSRIPYWVDFPDYTAEELTDIFRLMVQERGFRVTEEAVKEAHYIFDKARAAENFGNGRYVRNLIEHAIRNQAVRLLSGGRDAGEIPGEELFLLSEEDIRMPGEGLKKERAAGTARRELDEMIGLASVKKIIHKALARYRLNKLCMERGIDRQNPSMHMVFTGNPGTAKTTVARLFAEILRDEKVLSTGNFVEVGRADLVGQHVGKTAPKVKAKFQEARGGVLFIDEAYALCDSYENGYGDEAINTIVQEMENLRDEVIVIFAGYPAPMQQILERNPGMMSRIAFRVDFEDYSADELCAITRLMAAKKHMTITDSAAAKLKCYYDQVQGEPDSGNGRFVRKLLEEAEMNQAERILEMAESEVTESSLNTIEECDIPDVCLNHPHRKIPLGFAC